MMGNCELLRNALEVRLHSIKNLLGLVILAFLATRTTHAQDPSPAAIISVGPNVQISKQFSTLPHYENWAAGDPDHSGRLLACSGVEYQQHAARGPHCYASFDGGKTWSMVLKADEGRAVGDPYMAYGRGDTVYYTVIVRPRIVTTRSIRIYRSVDGGKNWADTGLLPFVDRQSIIVDKTGGKYAGRVYLSGVDVIPGVDGGQASSLHLFTSKDGGATFSGPVQRATIDGGSLIGSMVSVVLSDGTLAMITAHVKKDRTLFPVGDDFDRGPNAQLRMLTSTDGGETIQPAVMVSEWYLDYGRSEGAVFAQLAIDPGSTHFKDRLYTVWPDAGSGRVDIRFAYSADSGKTWSAPIIVNDDRPPVEMTSGPDHMLPAVAVNRQGVVLVAWYDRRESGDNMGWKIRAAASLDGGQTFSPSTVVSDAANVFAARTEWILEPEPRIRLAGSPRSKGRPLSVDVGLNNFTLSGGHTSGLAVDAGGVFHPVWVDNRTGVPQLWTASITVRGTVEKHGAPILAGLDDITEKVTLAVQSNRYDRNTNTVSITARLKNNSRETLRAPIRVRVTSLTSQLGVPALQGADNGLRGVGAILDLSSLIPAGGLLPDSVSAPKAFNFRFSDLRPLQAGREFRALTSRGGGYGLLHFDLRIFGRP
jgi:hypothetical protein